MNRSIIIIISAVMLSLLMPLGALAQEPPTCDQSYTVQAGDWLSTIAEKYLGDPLAYETFVVLANRLADDEYTNISNVDVIEPGWVLCIPTDDGDMTAPAMPEGYPTSLAAESLQNATYPADIFPAGSATLVNGNYSEEAAPGSASVSIMQLVDVVYGELNSQPSAVVILVSHGGGSGSFYDMAVVVDHEGQPTTIAKTMLGDRVQINSITIEANEIVVDMVQAGPDDAMCCPSEQVIKRFSLQGDQLMETSSEIVTSDEATDSAEMEAMPTAQPLADTTWQLATLNGADTVADTTVTLMFGADGSASGTAGCNHFNTTYTADDSALTIGLAMSTMMACEESVMAQESAFMAALESTATYQTDGESLSIMDADGNVVATFNALKPMALAGTSWQVISYNNGKEAVVSVMIDTELTANFDTNGRLSGSAGCNNYNSTYTVDGNAITIGRVMTTRMACGEPQGIMKQEAHYVAALSTAATYAIEQDRLEMRTAEGSLVASFQRIP